VTYGSLYISGVSMAIPNGKLIHKDRFPFLKCRLCLVHGLGNDHIYDIGSTLKDRFPFLKCRLSGSWSGK
jgi:hypothetical protein